MPKRVPTLSLNVDGETIRYDHRIHRIRRQNGRVFRTLNGNSPTDLLTILKIMPHPDAYMNFKLIAFARQCNELQDQLRLTRGASYGKIQTKTTTVMQRTNRQHLQRVEFELE